MNVKRCGTTCKNMFSPMKITITYETLKDEVLMTILKRGERGRLEIMKDECRLYVLIGCSENVKDESYIYSMSGMEVHVKGIRAEYMLGIRELVKGIRATTMLGFESTC